jgi:hypothetical protein
MNLLGLLPLLAAVVLVVVLLTSIASLFLRHQHPRRIFLRTISGASILAILGMLGFVPDTLWWASWLLTLAFVAGVVVACRRLLVRTTPAEPTRREAKHLTAPHPANIGTEVVIYLALLVGALVAG